MLLRMQAELLYFALSMAAGVLAALFGNGMKWLHRCRQRAVWLGCLDLLYWFLLGFSLFLLCFYQNSGIFRGYAVVGTLAGYVLFCTGVGFFRKDRGWKRRRRKLPVKKQKPERKKSEKKKSEKQRLKQEAEAEKVEKSEKAEKSVKAKKSKKSDETKKPEKVKRTRQKEKK